MDDDWDLHAVVRGCSGAISSSTTTPSTTTPPTNSQLITNFNQNFPTTTNSQPFQDLFFQPPTKTQKTSIYNEKELLHDLYKPFFPKFPEPLPSSTSTTTTTTTNTSSSQILLSPHPLPISPLSVLQDLPSSEQQILNKQLPQVVPRQHLFSIGSGPKTLGTSSRSKKRKSTSKKVCHVAAENLSSDMWSWRKYGQKPIKGSPYPRGYYKCSTLKGCMARKQVERNRSDPGMFIVTYTADHNHPMPTHRSSLSGSTRHKPDENTPNSDDPKKPSCSSEMSPEVNFSAVPEKLESSHDDVVEAEDDEDDFSVSDMAIEDDFFAGLEDLGGQGGGGEFDSDEFPGSSRLPWSVDSATSAAAAAGGS